MQADALNCMFLGYDVLVYITCSTQIKVPAHPACSLPAVFCKKHNVYDYFERESKKNKKIHQGIVKLKKKTVDK